MKTSKLLMHLLCRCSSLRHSPRAEMCGRVRSSLQHLLVQQRDSHRGGQDRTWRAALFWSEDVQSEAAPRQGLDEPRGVCAGGVPGRRQEGQHQLHLQGVGQLGGGASGEHHHLQNSFPTLGHCRHAKVRERQCWWSVLMPGGQGMRKICTGHHKRASWTCHDRVVACTLYDQKMRSDKLLG